MQPLIDWGFITEPQPVGGYGTNVVRNAELMDTHQGLNGRQLHYTQSKTLGGRS